MCSLGNLSNTRDEQGLHESSGCFSKISGTDCSAKTVFFFSPDTQIWTSVPSPSVCVHSCHCSHQCCCEAGFCKRTSPVVCGYFISFKTFIYFYYSIWLREIFSMNWFTYSLLVHFWLHWWEARVHTACWWLSRGFIHYVTKPAPSF